MPGSVGAAFSPPLALWHALSGQRPVSALPGELLDTSVPVYAFTTDRRAALAQALLERGCLVSVQALNEFANPAAGSA